MRMKRFIAFMLTALVLASFTCFAVAATTSMACEHGDGYYRIVSTGDWIALPTQQVIKTDPETGRLAMFYVYYEHRFVRMECSGNPSEHILYLDQQRKSGESLAWYID